MFLFFVVSINVLQYLHYKVVAHLFFDSNGEEVIRIISAREATSNERQYYEEL